MQVVISQPRYLPALNYIQRLKFSDVFVILDDVQRQSRGFENRNKILINGEPQWLTIPITSSTRELINNSYVVDNSWVDSHIEKLVYAYKKAKYFEVDIINKYFDFDRQEKNFTAITYRLLLNIIDIFNLKNNLEFSSRISNSIITGPEKLYNICKNLNADKYISGPNGRDYNISNYFIDIKVCYHDFEHPIYLQYGNGHSFIPYMSFFDCIFNIGLDETIKIINKEPKFLWS